MHNHFKKVVITCVLALFAFKLFAGDSVFDKVMEAGKDEFAHGNYESATRYFQIAQQLDESSIEPIYYLSLIKRFDDDAVLITREQTTFDEDYHLNNLVSRELDRMEKYDKRETIISSSLDAALEKAEKPNTANEKSVNAVTGKSANTVTEKSANTVTKKPTDKVVSNSNITTEKIADKTIKRQTRSTAQAVERVVDLTKSDPKNFPMVVELFIDQSIVVRSNNIKRWLNVSNDFVDVQRMDASNIRIIGKSLGPTVVHVWNETGRWTFSVKIVPLTYFDETKGSWDESGGFKFYYNNNWRGYYNGKDVPVMKRNSLTFDQDLGFSGPTPYGDLDSSMQWSYYNGSNEVDTYTLGLSDGHLLGFNDFNARVFDFGQGFSDLTFPGSTLRGALFDSYAFSKALEYTFIWGSDKRSYGYLSNGLMSNEDSYVEGAQVRFFPKAKNTVILNYARGYGADREDYLRKKAYSVETVHSLGNASGINELAYDEDKIAGTSAWKLKTGKAAWSASYRNISKRYTTISGRPSNSAEVGGTLGLNWTPDDRFNFSSDLDAYRDRENYNLRRVDTFNYDWNGSASWSIAPTLNWNNNIFYTNSQQISFPQRNLSGNSSLNKTINFMFFGKRLLNLYAGYGYQKNINPLSPGSDYRRDSAMSGFRINLLTDLYGYANYTYSWVDDLYTSAKSTPSAFEAGFDWYRTFSTKLTANTRIYYRSEENVSSIHSFLSGEDSVDGSIGLTYSPLDGMELFCDGHLRKVWAIDMPSYFEGDVRIGTRLEWDSPLVWSSTIPVKGHVFKDLNGNAKMDADEQGIPRVTVMVGPDKVITNDKGEYSSSVRARSIAVTLDVSSVPKGYIVTTNSSVRLQGNQNKVNKIDFGVSSQSGIYGMVFVDDNGDGKFTKGEKAISKVHIKLDNKTSAYTNGEGTYFFGTLAAGKHTIALDVNSLPLDYIPSGSVRQQIETQEGNTYSVHFSLRKR